MTEPESARSRWRLWALLLGCVLAFVPPFFVSGAPPFGVGAGVVVTLRVLAVLLWVVVACAMARDDGESPVWGLLALLGLPGIVYAGMILAVLENRKKRTAPRRPSRFSVLGCLGLVLFSPILMIQMMFGVVGGVVVPLVAAIFLHAWPFWLDERHDEAFPFFAVLIIQVFGAFVTLFWMARFGAVLDHIRDGLREPVPSPGSDGA